jgi:signal transduction histidine kinase/Na+/proline symporter
MTSPAVILFSVILYMAMLFLVATFFERRSTQRKPTHAGALIYALSQGIYCTAWGFYGSVGEATSIGFLYVSTFLGSSLAMMAGWTLLRKLVRIKDHYKLTSIADFLSVRYGKSQAISAMVTLLFLIGLLPYVALQFKAMIVSTSILAGYSGYTASPGIENALGPVAALLMIVFTITFGLRRLTPSERHPGMMAALAVGSVIKLVSILACGMFVTYFLFHGFGDLLSRAQTINDPQFGLLKPMTINDQYVWFSNLFMSFFLIYILPRQFHVAVIENQQESNIRTSMVVVPLYLFLFCVAIFPIALGGFLLGFPKEAADSFVLTIPLKHATRWLAQLVYLGGFSASSAMIMVEATAMAIMLSNHVLLPIVRRIRPIRSWEGCVLLLRWGSAALFILAGYGYGVWLGKKESLGALGVPSFNAVAQLIPVLVAGLYWKRANRTGAFLGIAIGFGIWLYTLFLPSLANIGWVSRSLIENGPFGWSVLRPGALFGLEGLNPWVHSLFWSLLLGSAGLVLGSIFSRTSAEHQLEADRIVDIFFSQEGKRKLSLNVGLRSEIDAQVKHSIIREIFLCYFDENASEAYADICFNESGAPLNGSMSGSLSGSMKGSLSILQLGQIQRCTERRLAAAIGTPTAYSIVKASGLLTEWEANALQRSYQITLDRLEESEAVSQDELKKKFEDCMEKEKLLVQQTEILVFLSDASASLAKKLDREQIIESALQIAVPKLAEVGAIYLETCSGMSSGDANSSPKKCAVFRIASQNPDIDRRLIRDLNANLGDEPPLLRVLHAMKSQTSQVVLNEPTEVWRPFAEAGMRIQGSITLPLIIKGHTLGTLSFLSGELPILRSPFDITSAEEFAARVAMALENAYLYQSAQDAIRARDEFLSIASHELRTPLTPLRSQVQLINALIRKKDLIQLPREKILKLLKIADDQMERMSQLIGQLLDVSRLTSGKLPLSLEEVELGELTAQVVERYSEQLAKAGCNVTIHRSAPVVGMWDRLRTEQIVVNLLTNAAKHASSSQIEIGISEVNGLAQLSIRDYGKGISPEDQARIFNRFEKISDKGNGSGFGLGLFIAREIAIAHGGSIRVESQVGKGAKFIVSLPIANRATSVAA